MKIILGVLVGLLCVLPSKAKESAPKVQFYSRDPGYVGKENTLICHVSGFHPPELSIKVLRNGFELPESKQSDLAFEENWHYHLTKHVPFTPSPSDTYTCIVTHLGTPKEYTWETDM
ncbi:beta-2-microglobulin-like [Eleginops maclovinus]|uniref:beta-2-microglobulin-like n=1 Tax=Eleginops maclovinus TaxID=56733 RepID=UPI003080012F